MLFRPEERYFWKAQEIESCFVSKKPIFFSCVVFGQTNPEKTFFDILDRKERV